MAFPLVSGTVGEPTDVHAGMVAKRVRVAASTAVTLASAVENGDTIDGVVLATGNRVALLAQAAGAENGIYTVNASGAPTRALDFDESAEVLSGTLIVVSEGTANKDSVWMLTTNATITVGSTALVFFPVFLSGTGSPEGAVTAPIGARFARTDGSTDTATYRKESGTGNTGWVPDVAASIPANDSEKVDTSQTTTSTTYTDLATAGPAVTVTTGTKALVIIAANMSHSVVSGLVLMSVAVTGATTLAADDVRAFGMQAFVAGYEFASSWGFIIEGLTAGSNTFTAKYRSHSSGTGTFQRRCVSVVNMGS